MKPRAPIRRTRAGDPLRGWMLTFSALMRTWVTALTAVLVTSTAWKL